MLEVSCNVSVSQLASHFDIRVFKSGPSTFIKYCNTIFLHLRCWYFSHCDPVSISLKATVFVF